MSSSKKFVTDPKSRSKKPKNPYYTRQNYKANLSQDINRDNNAKSFDPKDLVINQATMSQKVYSGSKFELYLKNNEVWLRTQPQVKNYKSTILPLSRIRIHSLPIGIKIDNCLDVSEYIDNLDTIAKYLDIPINRIIQLAENYCKSKDVSSDKILIHQITQASVYQSKIKKISSTIKYR